MNGVGYFEANCLYLPVAPEDAKKREIECENPECDSSKYQYWRSSNGEPEEPIECYKCGEMIETVGETENASKGPNVTTKFPGPTIGNWRNYDNLYSWSDVQESDWDRWGIVDWIGDERLLILDFDLYEIEDKERVEELVKAVEDLQTRTHKSQSGGLHAFFLVDPEDLDNGKLPISLEDNVDDKLNGYVLAPTCKGYEVEIDKDPKEINPKNLPEVFKESDVPETPEEGGEIEYPTELDEDLYCFRQITKNPGDIPEGERRYACMVVAGHLRDENVPKAVAMSYMKAFWKRLKQPPEASSKRTWSDVKRIINDYYDESKDYRVGCKTVNRHLSSYCKREKCPLGQRLNAIENEENVVVNFDKKGISVEFLDGEEKVGELKIRKEGNKNFVHEFGGRGMAAESPLGLTGSEDTKQKKRSWLRKTFKVLTGKDIEPTTFKKKYWDPLIKEIYDEDIVSEALNMETFQTVVIRDMIKALRMERSTDPNVNYPVWLDVSFDGMDGELKLDSKKVLSTRNVKAAFMKEFGTIPKPLVKLSNTEWQMNVINELKNEGKVETFEELDSTQIYLVNKIKRRVSESEFTEDPEEAVSRMNFVLYKELPDDSNGNLLWIESERVKEVLEEERSNPNLSRVREWFGPELVEVGKQIWVGSDDVKKKRFWGFDPDKLDGISKEEIETQIAEREAERDG